VSLIKLSDNEITYLAKLAKEPKKLGREVDTIIKRRGLLGDATIPLREDTFLRIAIKNGVLEKSEEKAIRQMAGTEGLASLLSKINSSNVNQAKGHLKELKIGIECKNRGGSVVAFGRKFDDGIKQSNTDLDVLLQIGNKRFAVESKAYSTEIAADMVRSDIKSLEYFCNTIDRTAVPLFVFEKAPPKLAEQALKSSNVKFFYGNLEEVCSQIEMLSRLP
jgi:hypothetical protein